MHFRHVHEERHETTDLTLCNAAQQQANLVQHVINGVQQVLENPPNEEPLVICPPDNKPPTQTENSVLQNTELVPQMLQKMQQM